MKIVIEPGALAHLRSYLPPAHSFVIIADSNVRPFYAERIAQQLPNCLVLDFPAGETNKNRATWMQLTDSMLERGIGRDACVIAVGGGVTCDLAGFVAATYMRGVPVVQVPTSLLAMIDAAMGGKTGVDVPEGKNLVGAFHMPAAVVIDPTVLQTLPDPELSNGLAEAIKHGAIADAGYVDWIAQAAPFIFERRTHTLDSLIRRSVEIKSAIVQADVREAGERAQLNFGHTIAHALEQVSGYAIGHGHAVALGMLIEAEIGNVLGVTAPETVKDLFEALKAACLPHEIVFDEPALLIAATRTDKKRRDGTARYVLLARTGQVARSPDGHWTWEAADDVIRQALKQFSV